MSFNGYIENSSQGLSCWKIKLWPSRLSTAPAMLVTPFCVVKLLQISLASIIRVKLHSLGIYTGAVMIASVIVMFCPVVCFSWTERGFLSLCSSRIEREGEGGGSALSVRPEKVSSGGFYRGPEELPRAQSLSVTQPVALPEENEREYRTGRGSIANTFK